MTTATAFGDVTLFHRLPKRHPAPGFEAEGVEAFFYDGPCCGGRATRIFAWYGRPENASPEHPVPGVVLIHGGGATALPDWVRLWNSHGFAAISMDTCGGVPAWNENPYCRPQWPRHAHSGPAGWGNLADSEQPPAEQWMFHAVASALLARTLLASFPEVDAENIGLTGISWGAVIGCNAAGLEERFRFAIPVYGCGFFNLPESRLVGTGESDRQRDRWFQLWDPGRHLSAAAMPFLWLTGAEDSAFPLPAWQRSSAAPQGTVCRSLRIDYPHDHTRCWSSKTIFDFARSTVEGKRLPSFGPVSRDGENLHVRFDRAGRGIRSVELCFTRAAGAWQDRRWHTLPAKADGDEISAELPQLTTAAFFQCRDANGALWSSELLEIHHRNPMQT